MMLERNNIADPGNRCFGVLLGNNVSTALQPVIRQCAHSIAIGSYR